MTELQQQLNAVGVDSLPVVALHNKAWLQFCDDHSPLFEKAQRNNPDKPVSHHLLGILTKAHIEASSYVEANATSMQAMQQAFIDNLGSEHADKFAEQGIERLILATHLWLYLQGYLKLDFSLANDHAHKSAELISSVNQHDIQALRTQFLESYYLGMQRSPVTSSSRFNPFTWLKKLLG